jgi:hypothetical protein
MDFAALVFSVEASRRESQSALPEAEVQPCPTRGERIWAAVRRAFARAPAYTPDRPRAAAADRPPDRPPDCSPDRRDGPTIGSAA